MSNAKEAKAGAGKAAFHTGGEAVKRLLGRIDVDAELVKEEERAPSLKGAELNRTNRRIRILRNLKDLGIKPDQAFMTQQIPVIPPKYRPVYPDQSGIIVESPINHLYKNLLLVNKSLKDSKQLPLEEDRIRARGELHEALRVFQGWAEPSGSRKELMRGIFDLVASKGQPKGGYFQSKLLSKRQDVSGRSTIVLNPDLHMDQAGIPEEMAWRIFEPFMVQDLHSTGYPIMEAMKLVQDRDPRAKSALNRVVEKRPVILNRAPSLHKHGVLAFRPMIIKGKSIELPPLVTKGFGADFDGDTMSVEVPLTQEAVEEAMEMIPSKNMLSTSGRILTTPSQSSQLGLYLLTQTGKKTGKKYGTDSDALVSHKKGEIQTDDVISVNGRSTTVGRILVNRVLPPKLRDPEIMLNKKKTEKILGDLARNNPKEAPAVAEKLKDLGFRTAFEQGFSVKLGDFAVDRKGRDPVVAKVRREIERIRTSKASDKEKDALIEKALLTAQTELGEVVKKRTPEDNNLGIMVRAGARGNWGQVQQMTAAPIAVEDAMGNIVPSLIGTSYSEGLSPADYWTAMHGARKGMIERTLRTSEPGALNKSLLHTTVNYPVTTDDCNTTAGIQMPVSNPEIVDRYLAQDASKLGKRGDVITPALADQMAAKGVKVVIVRSPITCEAPKGVCQICSGLDEYGKTYSVGANLGAISAQAVTEPATQLTMSSFHGGGLASGEDKITDSFKRVKSLMEFPEEFPDKATLAETDGKVESITEATIGGWNVRIGGKNHYIAPDRKLRVKPNQAVEKGVRISSGNRDPKDVLKILGMTQMRTALVEDLADVYHRAGPYVKQKHFETVVRAITDSARVRDPGDSDFVPGDIVPYNLARDHNAQGVTTVPLDRALGAWLDEDVEGVSPEKILDEQDVEKLRALGKKTIRANPNPVDIQPVLKGIRTLPLHRRDWLSQLAFTHLKDAIRQGVPEGWKSELHETNPIPGVIYGAEFGMGKFASANEDASSEKMLARHLSDARDGV